MTKPSREISPARWYLISEIFAASLEYEGAQREEYLSNACDGDEDLFNTIISFLQLNEEVGDELQMFAVDRPGGLGEGMVELRQLGQADRIVVCLAL